MIIGTLPNADRNNLIPVVDEAFGVTTEALLHTDTQFSFNIHGGTGLVEGTDDLPNNLSAIVGLMERPGTDGPWGFVAADCPLSVEWEYDAGTVTEIWKTFGVEIVSARRENIDIGWIRPGPRYTLRLNGADYEGHIDIKKGDPLRCVVPAPAGGFPFPLRLVMGVSTIGLGTCPVEVRDVIIEGQIGHKALLSAEQKVEWGVLTTDMHLRIYQVGEVPGAPVDINIGSSLLTSLISYWKHDETSGTRNDSWGTNHLTDNNTVTSAAGVVNTSSQFTAANSEYLSRADNASLSVGDIDFAFGRWVYLDSKAANMDIITKWGGGGNSEYIVHYSSTLDRFRFLVSPDGADIFAVVADNFGSPPTATWIHIYAYHDSVANVIGISVNNGTANTVAHSTGVFNGTSAFMIGHRAAGGASHLNGRVDEGQFWKRVLTTDERTEIYTNPDWFHEL